MARPLARESARRCAVIAVAPPRSTRGTRHSFMGIPDRRKRDALAFSVPAKSRMRCISPHDAAAAEDLAEPEPFHPGRMLMPLLKNLSVGDRARVIGFSDAGGSYRRRLLALGLTPGAELSLSRIAPLGDPVEIRIRGFALSLRKDEASALLVEKLR